MELVRPDYIKDRKRVGRGQASGSGKTCGRGMNGQMSRSGSTHRAWFEGGQMPIQRRLPKRGFTNAVFKMTYQIVNLEQIEKTGLSEIDSASLAKLRLINDTSMPVKLLAKGSVKKAVSITVDACSAAALSAIEKAGGKVIINKKG